MSKLYVEYAAFAPNDESKARLNMPTGTLVATSAQNCYCGKSGLRYGPGVEYLTMLSGGTISFPQAPIAVKTQVYHYDDDGVLKIGYFVATKDGKVYHFNESVGLKTCAGAGDGAASACLVPANVAEDGVFLATNKGLWHETPLQGAKKIAPSTNGTVCVFGDRVFIAYGKGVAFSDAGDFYDFSVSAQGGGGIHFWEGKGDILQVLAMDDHLLLFKQNCILQLFAKGAAKDFYARTIGFTDADIVQGSAVRCGNVAVFTTDDGAIYRVEGVKVQKLGITLPKGYANARAAFGGDRGRYYLSAGTDTFVVCLDDGVVYSIFPMQGISECGAQVVGFVGGKLCRLKDGAALPDGESCTFTVENWAVKDEKEKVVEKLVLHGQGRAKVQFGQGRYAKSWAIELSDRGVALPIFERGKRFDLTLELLQGACVHKLGVEYSHVGDEK